MFNSLPESTDLVNLIYVDKLKQIYSKQTIL